jgi:hypothetical protein
MNNTILDTNQRIEQFDLLIQCALEHLELMRGTVYERYAEDILNSIIAEKEEFIARIVRSN